MKQSNLKASDVRKQSHPTWLGRSTWYMTSGRRVLHRPEAPPLVLDLIAAHSGNPSASEIVVSCGFMGKPSCSPVGNRRVNQRS